MNKKVSSESVVKDIPIIAYVIIFHSLREIIEDDDFPFTEAVELK